MIINDIKLSNAVLKNTKSCIRISNIGDLIKNEFNIIGLNEVLLYDVETMIRETDAIKQQIFEDPDMNDSESKDSTFWKGRKIAGVIPGDIDPAKMIAIGDFGFDLPICLDYRASYDNPSVVFLDVNTWVKIAENYSEFINRLERKEN